MPRRRITFKTCWARTRSTGPLRSALLGLVFFFCAALPANAGGPRPADPTVGEILAAYSVATRERDVSSFESVGTMTGEGLSGDFHSWRAGTKERDDERLGPRTETTLRLGARMYLRTAGGNVRELNGYLRRRALTADFVESGAFVAEPERAKFLGFGTLAAKPMWRLEVRADGGEPETLWIDPATGLPARIEFIDGDGPTTIDLSDWREVEGRRFAFKMITSDGDHAFDVVAQTTSIVLNAPIDDDVFAPLFNRTIAADAVQTVPLYERDSHVACKVGIAGQAYDFILDTGAQSVLLDSSVAKTAGLAEQGALEVRGASRSGGLHVLTLPRLDIGVAHLDDVVATSLDLHGALGGVSRLAGILGFPFFASSLVELDFAHREMRFGPPGSFVPRGQRVPLDLDRGLIEAVFRVDGSVDAPFIVDTGNSGELLLYHPFIATHPGIVPFSTRAVANYGIGGTAATYRSVLDELALGDIALYHQTADVVLADKGAFADRIDAGNIGLGILKNFVVTFDLANDALYLQKSDAFDDGRLRMAITPP